ncbi:MAG: ComF family protein [Chitinophagia bacterium]|nr:ComF family protein [Chitinophagia bacterium]NCA29773.1 ComF family protein [Chitinophagia bacterium]NDD15522.1 ComF family protein [Chitinophagia bacterium]
MPNYKFIRFPFIKHILNYLQAYSVGFFHLFYPHICMHCGNEELAAANVLCAACEKNLPYTHFLPIEKNSIEKIFWGRVSLHEAGASLFFTKDSIVQSLIFALKYNNQKKAGRLLGNIIGKDILNSQRFKNIDCMIPIPLSKKKQRERGYNQALIICEGIQEKIPHIQILPLVLKHKNAVSQTSKDRIQRTQLSSKSYSIIDKGQIDKKNILIVDDVITTGATIESVCKYILSEARPQSLSVVAAAYTI